jgi:hypothetical protein
MSNAITNNATVQTRTSGIGAGLRCVSVVRRDERARRLQRDLPQPVLHDPAKRLHLAHLTATPLPHTAASASFAGDPASAARMPSWSWSCPADACLPPAAWASLVIVRAVSA